MLATPTYANKHLCWSSASADVLFADDQAVGMCRFLCVTTQTHFCVVTQVLKFLRQTIRHSLSSPCNAFSVGIGPWTMLFLNALLDCKSIVRA